MKLYCTLIFLAAAFKGSFSDDPCDARATQYGSVCVCNSSYCDTITRPSPLPRGHYYHYTTSQDSPGFSRTTGSFSNLSYQDDNNTTVFTVNRTIQHQELIGFGGSFTDATGMAITSLPIEAQDHLMQSYFGTNGIEHSMARVPVGGSDFSLRFYTYDDVPGDEDLLHFSLQEEDFKYKIPLLQKALSLSPHEMKLICATFSAPAWMKTNNYTASAYVLTKYYDVFAKYFIKFFDAYAQEGIKFWLMSGGNEPMIPMVFGTVGFGFNTVAMPMPQRQWVHEHLGPVLKASNHSHIRLALVDDQRSFANYWMDRFSADPKAFELVEGVAIHWYWDFLTPVSLLDDLHRKYPDKSILYTETSILVLLFGGQVVEPGSWHRGALYAYNIMQNINHFTNTYVDWNLALNSEGGPSKLLPTDSAIIVNATVGEFYKNPMFYALGHFSKFMLPGSRRVEVLSNLNQTKIDVQNQQYSQDVMSRVSAYRRTQEQIHRVADGTTTPTPVLPPFPTFPIPKVPQTISFVASTNPDNSSTVILFNSSYFGTNGIEHSMARVPVGGSDFSLRFYTYDDVPGDEHLLHFSLQEEDFKYKIPLLQKALSLSPHEMKLICATFSAPAWMKTNNYTASAYVLTKYYHVFAKYFIKFFDAYAQEGIKFWLMSGGNEPMIPMVFGTVGFGFNTVAMPMPRRQWVHEHLGPVLKASNHSHIRLALVDDQRSFANYWMDRFSADPKAFELVEGVAIHWYWDFLTPVSLLDDLHRKYPDKSILYTETSILVLLFGGQVVEPGSWHRGALYAYNIMQNINHFTNTYVDWNLALNSEGGPSKLLPTDSAIIVNATVGEFYKNPMFYALGHFSKFMHPGSRRVEVQSNLNQTKIDVQHQQYSQDLMSRVSAYRRTQEQIHRVADGTTTPTPVLPPFPTFPIPKVPQTISFVASTNPDNSSTVILFNSQDVPAAVTIVDQDLGSFSTTLAAQSINTFVYWPNS